MTSLDKIKDQEQEAILKFYMNTQESVRFHGERMWASMKFVGIILPGFTGILTFVIDYMLKTNAFVIGNEILLLFTIPFLFTVIFWLNVYRENIRFLEYTLMSWRAEKLLGFHKTRKELLEDGEKKPLVIKRFTLKPPNKPKLGANFWTINCSFFLLSIILQIIFVVALSFAI